MLQIHNNLSKRKEPFTPIDPQNVRIYVCGMTVYDYCHVGHARVLVVFDVVYRYLCQLYGKAHVTYVRNITDIDDKIITRAQEQGEGIEQLTGRYIEAMHEDIEALGVLSPNEEPRATGHMQEIVAMIQTLVDKGYAYQAANNDVYYDVSRFASYGRLSGKQLEDLHAGARIAVDESKDDPLDFVLWKAAKPGEPHWDSPWGPGRPGWHIECSAMSTGCLGNHFDIHGGGLDLQFPHHENEIAQSEAATGEQFVNVWMHNGFVRVDEEKMSKSLGNFFTIREVTQKYVPEVLRFFILSSHYRSPLNYSDQHLENARAALITLYTALRGLEVELPAEDEKNSRYDAAIQAETAKSPEVDVYMQRFTVAMDDDFNTPEVLAILFDLARAINRQRESAPMQALALASLLRSLGEVLGLLQQAPEIFLQSGGTAEVDDLSDEQIAALLEQRNAARQRKDFATADRVRDELLAHGIILEDGATGTTWRRE